MKNNSGTTFDLKSPVRISDVSLMNSSDFKNWVASCFEAACHLSVFMPLQTNNNYTSLLAVFANNNSNKIRIAALQVEGKEFDSLTPEFPQFHIFERDIYERSGVKPLGHPWLKPVRFPTNSKFGDGEKNPIVGDIDFFRIDGYETHQVAVGPVHAGIIEPGHFRFQCHGEIVHHLEISLGYQHRGIEKTLIGKPNFVALKTIEVAAGDSTVAESYSYCKNIEQLSGAKVGESAEKLRIIALELERCANHIGDLGAMAGDVGYLPTMSYCGRIRGDFLNMTGLICGNRFGRGIVVPGGVGYSINSKIIDELLKRLEAGKKDFLSAVDLLWDSSSVLARFEDTGIVPTETAGKIGMVGVAARASGLEVDSRSTRHGDIYKNSSVFKPAMEKNGDVAARGIVRYNEVLNSIGMINDLLQSLDSGVQANPVTFTNISPDSISVSFAEGWRGEVCHIAVTDNNGNIADYRIIDPSVHNWFGLALALRGEKVSDFPICNKSFSLSYCGFDL